jgi:hypothetical protein
MAIAGSHLSVAKPSEEKIMLQRKTLYTYLVLAFASLTIGANAETPSTSDRNATMPGVQADAPQDRLPVSKERATSEAQDAAAESPDNTAGRSEVMPGQQDSSDKNTTKKHPPTAIMDHAMPAQNTPAEQSTRKHPPTSVMDSVTPKEQSPGATPTP